MEAHQIIIKKLKEEINEVRRSLNVWLDAESTMWK